jgi:hypothetical protein
MIKIVLRTLSALVLLALATVGGVAAAEAYPEPFFANHTELGRLSLYSDRPFDAARGRAILADVDARLATSPIDDQRQHAIFVANSPWREALFFNLAYGAAGVNHSPLSRNVFLRHSDIDSDTVFGRSGRAATPPRTLAYYCAHELAHSLTGEHLGPGRLWNAELPQWVREGYADYVGMGGRVDIDDLYRRYRAGDPALDYRKSGLYSRFRLLTAFVLEREHWSVDQLLATKLTQAQAETLMNDAMTAPTS